MPPISHFGNIPLTWAPPYNGADACKALTRGVCVLHKESPHLRGSLLIKEQTHVRRLRAASACFTRNPPHLRGSLLMKINKKRRRMRLCLSYKKPTKRIPTAALPASGCGSERSAPSQPAASPAPHTYIQFSVNKYTAAFL